MEQTLTLNDGTIVEGYALQDGQRLFVYLLNSDMETAFNLFINPELTEKIDADRCGDFAEYTGYTEMQSVSRGNGRQVNIMMTLARGGQ
jgi:hypothetical protein